MDHFSVSGARFQENFNEQGKQEDNRHFSLVVIGFSLGLRGLRPGYQRWDCSCQQATKEMESTRIEGCLFFLTVSVATDSAAVMEQRRKAVPELEQKCGSTGSRMLSVQLNLMRGARNLSDLVEL